MALFKTHVLITMLFLATLFLFPNPTTSSRNFPVVANNNNNNNNNPTAIDLLTRLKISNYDDGSNSIDCWTSLSELRTCSNEIIGFFLNGYTDIDAPCCQAIEVIIHKCWPSMITVLGFTTEEGNMLAAYCKNDSSAPPPHIKAQTTLVTVAGNHV